MKRIALPALAALAMGGWIAPALAQEGSRPVPPAPGSEMPFDLAQMGPGMGPPHGPPDPRHERMMRRPGAPGASMGGLIFRREDRALTAPEVQRIAEAFLIWNGERSWKVGEVSEEDRVVRFAFTTAEGGVIARFTMDRRSGRVRRVG